MRKREEKENRTLTTPRSVHADDLAQQRPSATTSWWTLGCSRCHNNFIQVRMHVGWKVCSNDADVAEDNSKWHKNTNGKSDRPRCIQGRDVKYKPYTKQNFEYVSEK